jgi:hypothetical protein
MVSPRLKRQKRNLSPMSSLILTILKSIIFNFALNSKQSTCETAAKKCVVDETWPKFKKQGKIVHNQGAVQAQAGGNRARDGGFLLVLW